MLEIDPARIKPDSTFASLGLDSATAVHFILEVEGEYRIELYPGVTDDYPDLARFVEYLESLK